MLPTTCTQSRRVLLALALFSASTALFLPTASAVLPKADVEQPGFQQYKRPEPPTLEKCQERESGIVVRYKLPAAEATDLRNVGKRYTTEAEQAKNPEARQSAVDRYWSFLTTYERKLAARKK